MENIQVNSVEKKKELLGDLATSFLHVSSYSIHISYRPVYVRPLSDFPDWLVDQA
jgi:hypothetical protein